MDMSYSDPSVVVLAVCLGVGMAFFGATVAQCLVPTKRHRK